MKLNWITLSLLILFIHPEALVATIDSCRFCKDSFDDIIKGISLSNTLESFTLSINKKFSEFTEEARKEQQNLYSFMTEFLKISSSLSSQINTNDLLACSNSEFLCHAIALQSYIKSTTPSYRSCSVPQGTQSPVSTLVLKFYKNYWNIEKFFTQNTNPQGFMTADYFKFSRKQVDSCMIDERENPCGVTFCKMFGGVMYNVFSSAVDKGLGVDSSHRNRLKQAFDEYIETLPI